MDSCIAFAVEIGNARTNGPTQALVSLHGVYDNEGKEMIWMNLVVRLEHGCLLRVTGMSVLRASFR